MFKILIVSNTSNMFNLHCVWIRIKIRSMFHDWWINFLRSLLIYKLSFHFFVYPSPPCNCFVKKSRHLPPKSSQWMPPSSSLLLIHIFLLEFYQIRTRLSGLAHLLHRRPHLFTFVLNCWILGSLVSYLKLLVKQF